VTEAEWLECADPSAMLEFVRANASRRKLLLFACACCRHAWHLMRDERCRNGVEVIERYVDGEATAEQLEDARLAVEEAERDAFEIEYQAEADAGFALDGPYCSAMAQRWLAFAVLRLFSPQPFQPPAQARWFVRPEHNRRSPSEWVLLAITRRAFGQVLDGNLAARTLRSSRTAPVRIPADVASARMSAYEGELQAAMLREVFGRTQTSVQASPFNVQGETVLILASRIYRSRAFGHLPVLADALEDAGCTDAELLGHLRGPGPHVRGCWAVDLILATE
jgi:hypothetical protein